MSHRHERLLAPDEEDEEKSLKESFKPLVDYLKKELAAYVDKGTAPELYDRSNSRADSCCRYSRHLDPTRFVPLSRDGLNLRLHG